MEIKKYPIRGEYIFLMCKFCFKPSEMKITAVKKHNQNSDGSYCYSIKTKCSKCGYLNGEFRPIWFNFYSSGVIDS